MTLRLTVDLTLLINCYVRGSTIIVLCAICELCAIYQYVVQLQVSARVGAGCSTTALALQQHGMVDSLTAAARIAARQRRREEAGSCKGGGDGRDGGVGGGS